MAYYSFAFLLTLVAVSVAPDSFAATVEELTTEPSSGISSLELYVLAAVSAFLGCMLTLFRNNIIYACLGMGSPLCLFLIAEASNSVFFSQLLVNPSIQQAVGVIAVLITLLIAMFLLIRLFKFDGEYRDIELQIRNLRDQRNQAPTVEQLLERQQQNSPEDPVGVGSSKSGNSASGGSTDAKPGKRKLFID